MPQIILVPSITDAIKIIRAINRTKNRRYDHTDDSPVPAQVGNRKMGGGREEKEEEMWRRRQCVSLDVVRGETI